MVLVVCFSVIFAGLVAFLGVACGEDPPAVGLCFAFNPAPVLHFCPLSLWERAGVRVSVGRVFTLSGTPTNVEGVGIFAFCLYNEINDSPFI